MFSLKNQSVKKALGELETEVGLQPQAPGVFSSVQRPLLNCSGQEAKVGLMNVCMCTHGCVHVCVCPCKSLLCLHWDERTHLT